MGVGFEAEGKKKDEKNAAHESQAIAKAIKVIATSGDDDAQKRCANAVKAYFDE